MSIGEIALPLLKGFLMGYGAVAIYRDLRWLFDDGYRWL